MISSLVPLVTVLVGACALVALVPMILVLIASERRRRERRPIDQVLADAVAESRITEERFEEMMDEVHHSMASLDRPYPSVREKL